MVELQSLECLSNRSSCFNNFDDADGTGTGEQTMSGVLLCD